jgi:hypothetical protein
VLFSNFSSILGHNQHNFVEESMTASSVLGVMRLWRQHDDLDAYQLIYSFQGGSEFRNGVHDEQARHTKLGEDLLIKRLRNRGRVHAFEGISNDKTGHSFHNIEALAIIVPAENCNWGPDVGGKHVKLSVTR